ncbi:MAG: short chain dehydrogenase [Bacteriovoracaceae bacterium]|nr:short chain dehydrogenase [Bacteriovoracaceae bacterium]
MKVLVFGATGTIGTKVSDLLSENHEVIKVGKTRGDYQADISSLDSLKALFEKTGKVDAIISTTGDITFAPVNDLTKEQWDVGYNSKFLGQVNLVQFGKKFLNEGGSITLTTGILSEKFIMAGASATAINRAVEGYAQAAASELSDVRINVVSPTLLEESTDIYGDFFPGFIPVPGNKVAYSYKRSVEGIETGKIYTVV